MSLSKRGGWPYGNPPNTQFAINTQSPQAQGLVGWWPTLGSRGSALGDYARGHRGSFVGAPLEENNAQLGRVLAYDGNDAVSIGAIGLTPAAGDGTTLAAWARVDAIGGWQNVVNSRLGASWAKLQWFNNNWVFEYDGFATSLNSPATLNAWTLIVGVYSAGTRTLYIDGIAKATGFNVGALADDDWAIGYWKSAASEFFKGSIGDVRIYNRALSAGQVWALYNPVTRWELYAPVIPSGVVHVAAGGLALPIFSSAGIHSTLFGGQVIR